MNNKKTILLAILIVAFGLFIFFAYFWTPNPDKPTAIKKNQQRSTRPPQIISQEYLNVGSKWTTLSEVPDLGEEFVFEIPDTTTKLLWQYEGGYGRTEIPLFKRNEKQVGGMEVDGRNPTRAKAQVKTKLGNRVKIRLKVQ